MAVTSGVRAIRAFLRIDGTPVPVESMTVTLPAERKSASWSAEVAISALPMGEAYFASQNPDTVDCVVVINGAETVLLSGVLDSMDAPLAETKLSLKGRCKSAKLHEKKSREKFTNKKPDEIIKDLAGRVGLGAEVDDFGYKANRFVQIDWSHLTYGHSYSEIIHAFCEHLGARWWVDGKTLKVKADPDSAVYMVDYQRGNGMTFDRSDALRVSVTRNFQAARPAKITTQGYDSRKKKSVKETANVSGVGETVEYTYENHGIAPERAKKHSKGKGKEHGRQEFNVSVSMAGDVDVARASKLRLTGNVYAQDFEIDNITHTIAFNGGFKTDITARGMKQGRTVT